MAFSAAFLTFLIVFWAVWELGQPWINWGAAAIHTPSRLRWDYARKV